MDERASIPVSLPHPNPTPSYWHSDTPLTPVPHPISKLRSTDQLPEYADYVVVGSGISGAMIAWGILERLEKEGSLEGKNVVMLEARAAVGGATGRNGGHTKSPAYRTYPSHVASHSTAEAGKIAHLEYANINDTHKFAAAHNLACESRPCPTVDIIYDKATFNAGIASMEAMKQDMGEDDGIVKDYEIFTGEEAKKEFFVDGDVAGAFRYQTAGSINAYKFAIGVLELCIKKGLNVQTFTAVEKISSSSEHGSPSWTAQTPRGSIKTPNLILATNAYTPHLLPLLQTKIVPLRGQVTAHIPSSNFASLHPKGLPTTYSFIYANGYEYMIPRPKIPSVPADLAGDIVIGGGLGVLKEEGLSEYGETDDSVKNKDNEKYLGACVGRYFGPEWGDEERVRMEWTGIMGITGDGLPYVGPVPESPGLWVSAGFNGHGMVFCLKSAEALIHMLFSDPFSAYPWFPHSLLITTKRIDNTIFEGRKGMKASQVTNGL